MEPLQIPHDLAAPIYGIVAYAHIHLGLPGSKYVTLQALALLEAVAPHDKYPGPFYATTAELATLTGLTRQTIIKTLKDLEKDGVLTRETAPFAPTLFRMYWCNTAVTFDQFTDLADAQDALRLELGLPM